MDMLIGCCASACEYACLHVYACPRVFVYALVPLHKSPACHFCGLLVFFFSAHAAFCFGWDCCLRFFFVYNILLLPFWLALISVAVGNGKAMRMAATAAALKSKVQVNDKRKTPIKQSHFTRPYNSYSPKTLIKCPLWGLNP